MTRLRIARARQGENSAAKVSAEHVTLGAELRRWREVCGITGHVMARRLGIGQASLSRLEAGLARWTAELRDRFLEVLRVEPGIEPFERRLTCAEAYGLECPRPDGRSYGESEVAA